MQRHYKSKKKKKDATTKEQTQSPITYRHSTQTNFCTLRGTREWTHQDLSTPRVSEKQKAQEMESLRVRDASSLHKVVRTSVD